MPAAEENELDFELYGAFTDGGENEAASSARQSQARQGRTVAKKSN